MTVLNQIVPASSSASPPPPQNNNPIQGILQGVGNVLNQAGVEVRNKLQMVTNEVSNKLQMDNDIIHFSNELNGKKFLHWLKMIIHCSPRER